ncbi:MAG TPA: OmpH family outer membrane protein [Gammaproteobacteria bacterium]|nr:OmpH family outer membrane protein [Gammaproteobacteria bacterium]
MKLFNLIKASVVTLFLSFAYMAAAQAQSTILVVDQTRVLQESEVGKHVKRQLESISKAMENEVKNAMKPIESEGNRLKAELKNMSVDALKSRPDLQQRAKTLQEKMQKQQVEAAYKQRELQITEQKAMNKVKEKLATILKSIVDERKADVMIDRSVIIYTSPSADVTDTVISRLNSQMRTVSVIRERLPRKPLTAPKK